MSATISDRFMSYFLAISFRPFQNASSRLTLVLWPIITIDRLTTGDFIIIPLRLSNADFADGRLNRPTALTRIAWQNFQRHCKLCRATLDVTVELSMTNTKEFTHKQIVESLCPLAKPYPAISPQNTRTN